MTLPLLDDINRFKLAVVALNVSGGLSAATAAGTIRGGDWNEGKALAIAADQAGFDALIRRFLLHVLPKGFHRIRHYGLLASSAHKAGLVRAR